MYKDSKKHGYHLISCHLRQIITFYSTPQQRTVFEGILKENQSLRRNKNLCDFLQFFGVGGLGLCLYAHRTTQQFKNSTLTQELVAFAGSSNQKRGIEYIKKITDENIAPEYIQTENEKYIRILKTFFKFATVLKKGTFKKLLKAVVFLNYIYKKHGHSPALNASIFIFNHSNFLKMFSMENKLAITANDFHPIPLAFKTAAQLKGLKQIFVMHGQISSAESGNIFPRLDYDLALLYGPASLEAYRQKGEPIGRVLFTGFPGDSAPMKKIKKLNKIGICLAHYFDPNTQKTIEDLAQSFSTAKIILRYHPSANTRPELKGEADNIQISSHDSIQSFAYDCDIVIAGNTGAQIDILKYGTPIIYAKKLDDLGEDDIGLVENRVVMPYDNHIISPQKINNFFNDEWAERFKHYDALYLASPHDMANMRKALEKAYKEIQENP